MIMADHRCDMCAFYDMDHEYCYTYHENHYPSDGKGCPGWVYWDDPELRTTEQMDTRPMEG